MADESAQISRDSLSILLEYAYRGQAAQGGFCHLDRQECCAMCDALTEAEGALTGDPESRRDWWTPTLRERYWRFRHGRRMRKQR
jgi:hypothetical protein